MALILYAPNVHTGGGRVLLEALDDACGSDFDQAILDRRLRDVSTAFSLDTTLLVRNRILSRFQAEWHLRRTTRRGDTILCLHSLPPLLPVRANVVVLVQNRLLIDNAPLHNFPRATRLRISVERLWARWLQQRCTRYLVQTPSMLAAVKSWLRVPVPIAMVPFAPPGHATERHANRQPEKRFDFVYIASGEAHKNHRNLLGAWQLLAETGLKPSLAMTIDPAKYPELDKAISYLADALGLNVVNLGTLNGAEVSLLYSTSSALIFPSTCESFGLPLIEAAQHNLPIIAPELDYVRDVAIPAETFDARSSVSIARAVQRFLGHAERPMPICSGEALLREVLK